MPKDALIGKTLIAIGEVGNGETTIGKIVSHHLLNSAVTLTLENTPNPMLFAKQDIELMLKDGVTDNGFYLVS